MPPMYEDSTEPLVSERQSRLGSMTTNRILSILSLVALVGVSLYFQWQVQLLTTELVKEEVQISDLNSIINKQAEVIQRFNTSVTNSDVLKHLTELEKSLNATELELKHELKRTEDSIENQLSQTLTTLDQTVTKAQEDIKSEVEKVKDDVDEYVRSTQDQFSMENDFMIYQLAGTFTLLSGLISMWHMTAHLRRYNEPSVQRKILAILWMCPIYAVTSWLSLVFIQFEGYLAIVKDFYEAYIIYQFLSFCIAVLGRGDRETVVDILAENANHLTPPFRLCPCCNPDPYVGDRDLANAVLLQCQCFAMQFVFLKPLTTIALFVLEKMDYYGKGDSANDYRSPQFYLIMIQNLSVFIAFAGLLKFYHAVDKELAWCRPFAKFLCIKGVVFMTFWQGLAISILASTTDVGGDDAQTWARSSQNFLICLEMLLFSIAHFYCFPVEEWEEGYKAAHSGGRFGDSIALNDFLQDLKLIVSSNKKKGKSLDVQPQILEALEEGKLGKEDDDEIRSETSAISEDIDVDADADDDPAMNTVHSEDVDEATMRLLNSLAFMGGEINVQKPEPNIGESSGDGDDSLGIESTGEENEGTGIPPTEEEEPPNETTSLLGAREPEEAAMESMRTRNDDMLRPSIFTTVSDIGERSGSSDSR